MTNKEIDNILRQPIILYEENKIKRRLKAEKFIFSYLIKKGGKGKIYELLLNKNGFDDYLSNFLSDIEFYTSNNLIKILKSKKRSIKLELTLSGKVFYDSKEKQEIIIPSFIYKVKVYLIEKIKGVWYFAYVVLDRYLLKFFKSGWGFLILAVLAFLYFYLPFKSSNDQRRNNKPNVQTIEAQQQVEMKTIEGEKELVYIKDSLLTKKDSLIYENKP